MIVRKYSAGREIGADLPRSGFPGRLEPGSDSWRQMRITAQKRFGGVHVPVPAEKEIDCLARFVDGAVQVHPLSVNL
jgi:hypothetical protein